MNTQPAKNALQTDEHNQAGVTTRQPWTPPQVIPLNISSTYGGGFFPGDGGGNSMPAGPGSSS